MRCSAPLEPSMSNCRTGMRNGWCVVPSLNTAPLHTPHTQSPSPTPPPPTHPAPPAAPSTPGKTAAAPPSNTQLHTALPARARPRRCLGRAPPDAAATSCGSGTWVEAAEGLRPCVRGKAAQGGLATPSAQKKMTMRRLMVSLNLNTRLMVRARACASQASSLIGGTGLAAVPWALRLPRRCWRLRWSAGSRGWWMCCWATGAGGAAWSRRR
ncbi:uncharacterized protein CC84DRAFT_374122 [Paraphaeosphaeria sporulosa]|uniref:Uncharacterized protein n=1 Tax=Paraphaeosphaeria sporulosa TaxID=1460663 RepID=A0A177BXD7_9PLEO|nr:uncharacterized protein CC84DRAFT_374122 [Paraphaeosphaeria sporulosa]OAF99620.1 hypothetical protein CC84DRAFT_374122 [Paraphaeosphaeria sporulosa]